MTESTTNQVSAPRDGAHDSHPNNTALFLKVFAALCVLTAISFGIASSPLMNSRGLAWASMMVVSCAKAFLVISFFMHLKWERSWKYVLTIPAILMSLFLVLSLVPDIALRSNAYSQARWRHATEPQPTIPDSQKAADSDEDVKPEPTPSDAASQSDAPVDGSGESTSGAASL